MCPKFLLTTQDRYTQAAKLAFKYIMCAFLFKCICLLDNRLMANFDALMRQTTQLDCEFFCGRIRKGAMSTEQGIGHLQSIPAVVMLSKNVENKTSILVYCA